MAEEGVNVCFADVAAGEESVVKMLHAGVLYLYEPSAGSLPTPADTAAWRTLQPGVDITVSYDPTDTSVVTTPRLRTCDLRVLAKQFLGACHRVPELKGGKQPVFVGVRCVLLPTKRVLRTKPGVFGVHAKTLIAFGAAEMVTGMYHLLVFSLQLPCPGKHPRVQVAIAKAYGGLRGDEAFTTALRKCGIYVGAEGHDCEKGCSNDEVGVRKTFQLGAAGLNEIRCEGLGITIEGWNGDIARAPGEEEAARRVWEMERTIERMRMDTERREVSFPG
ncbi:hypothetical protein K440DRAFT_610187 [Wilcoxina mikolae CBS 423.85]|nr:hypothetical protein K440DRAFT_610187 [Wilcoxina mikolae CBS 423.85]